jgi:hypothetical protein
LRFRPRYAIVSLDTVSLNEIFGRCVPFDSGLPSEHTSLGEITEK